MPHRPTQHESDEVAQRIFRSALPPSWVVNEIKPDYCKDYLVEVVEKTALTGTIFIVQLKGVTIKAKRRGRSVAVRIEREHLEYYLNKYPIPVFVVGADVNGGKAYFEFAQGAIHSDPNILLKKPSMNRVSFHVRTENSLNDTARLKSSITAAWQLMRERYPGSVTAAVDFKRALLEAADPDLTFKVEFLDGHESITFMPKKPGMKFKMRLKGDPAVNKAKLDALLGAGTPIIADESTAIEIEGSPAFKLFGSKVEKVEHELKQCVEATLFAEDATGTRAPFPEFRGELRGGRRELKLEGRLAHCPLKLMLRLVREETRVRAFSQWQWRPVVWAGEPLKLIPWLDQIRAALDCLAGPSARLGVRLSAFGNVFIDDVMKSPADAAKLVACKPLVDALHRAREVARVLDLAVKVPEQWREADFDDLEELHSIVSTGSYTFPNRYDFSCTLDGVMQEFRDEVARIKGGFRLTTDGPTYEFLGDRFDCSGWQTVLDDWRDARVTDVQEDGHARVRVELMDTKRTHVWPRFLKSSSAAST